MGLFDFLLRTDMTRHWVPDPGRELVFDFDDGSLCGIRLGDRADALSGLGPAEDSPAARKGLLRYYSLGLEIETENELVTALALVWSWANEWETRFHSFAGRCLQQGEAWPLHRETNFLDITARLGEPAQQDQDDAGLTFVYLSNRVRLEFDFDTLDLLESVTALPRD